MADLSERPTIRQYNATVVAKRTDQRLARLGRSQNVVIKTSASMMLELAELGLGYVVLTGCAMGSRRYDMEAFPIAELSVTWTIRTLRTHPKTAPVKLFAQILRT